MSLSSQFSAESRATHVLRWQESDSTDEDRPSCLDQRKLNHRAVRHRSSQQGTLLYGKNSNENWRRSISTHHNTRKMQPNVKPRTHADSASTLLQAASAGGRLDEVKMLLKAGADVNGKGSFSGNALQAASEGGHLGVVKLLLDAGADVNARGGHFGSALQAASWAGHRDVVRLLLDTGAKVDEFGGEFGSAIQAASEGGHGAIVDLLKSRGAMTL